MTKTVCLVAVLVSLSACYRSRRLTAPPVPERLLPSVPHDGAPAPGLSRVLIDVADGPAVVETISGGSVSGIAGTSAFGGSLQVARRVCVSPCVLDISPGSHELRFTSVDDESRTSVGFINADTRVSAYRHALGRHSNAAWKGFVGWPVLLTGAVLDISFVSVVSRDGMSTGDLVGMGLFSVGLTALGAWLVHGSVVEDQPGSGVQWYPE